MRIDSDENSLDKLVVTGNDFQTQGNSSKIPSIQGFSFLKKRLLAQVPLPVLADAVWHEASSLNAKVVDLMCTELKKKTQVFLFWNHILNRLIEVIFVLLG